MKKFIFLITLFVYIFYFQSSFAQAFGSETGQVFDSEAQTRGARRESSQSAVQSPTSRIEYQLPYPGLLPDSPLYFLKTFRDRIIGFLISDPLRKAEFDLLTADKRLNGGVYLFRKDKSKEDLAFSTISKGENYFGQAISKIREAKKQGIDATFVLKKLSLSLKKHKEVLKELETKVSQKRKEEIKMLEKRGDNFENEVNQLSPK